ncbi:MAG: aminodeoxychorismate/anthranilate synthase component II [Desulfobacterales bacterium]|nr:aminodeoxychorismate/anthranilate synthase component II [Desulfobacterales bacterium]
MSARLLVIDNYDSFTYNLVQMFMLRDLDIQLFRSDRLSLEDAEAFAPDYLLISPGPKDPAHAGQSIPLIRAWYRRIPVLGVCLGMQCLNEVFGGHTVRAPLPRHGKTSRVRHDGHVLFQGLENPFEAARYHSLMVNVLSDELQVTAWSDDDVVMGLSHADYPLHGVQFHPESFLTPGGAVIIGNFLDLGPLADTDRHPALDNRPAAARLTIHAAAHIPGP